MSSLIVEVCKVEETATHPNADRIERVRVKNWWCIAGKGQYKVGDLVVYVPPDSVLPEDLANRWGIAKYCVPLGRDISGERPAGLRVRASRFRGVSSFGTLQNLDDPTWEAGKDVREHYGITKYEPPMKCSDGDAAPNVAAFHEYTSIEALGNFPNVFTEGEEVIVTEKIHGTNSRVGEVYHLDENGQPDWVWMAGSHGSRRKEFNDKGIRSKYWLPFKENSTDLDDPMKEMIDCICAGFGAGRSVVVFGEIFGPGIQDMHYGQKGLTYRIFDIAVDGNYLDHDDVEAWVGMYKEDGISMVPILYRGPYSLAKMDELVDGPTTVANKEDIKQPFKGREGIVVKPIKERFDPVLGGRAILKYVSVDYHERKNADRTEDH